MTFHFYMNLSGGSKYEIQAEYLIRSVYRWSGLKKTIFTICIPDNERIESKFLLENCNIITQISNYLPSWYGGLYNCPQLGDITIYIDTDIIVINNITELANNKNKIQGVLAFESPFVDEADWIKLLGTNTSLNYKTSYSMEKIPYYLNLGFVAVPSNAIKIINYYMKTNLKFCYSRFKSHYHIPQLAFCKTMIETKIDKTILPISYNFPDLYPEFEKDKNRKVCHLLYTKSFEKGKNYNTIVCDNLDKIKILDKTKII